MGQLYKKIENMQKYLSRKKNLEFQEILYLPFVRLSATIEVLTYITYYGNRDRTTIYRQH